VLRNKKTKTKNNGKIMMLKLLICVVARRYVPNKMVFSLHN